MWIFPAEKWWKLLLDTDVVVYFYFPIIRRGLENRGRSMIHPILIRGTVLSMEREKRFGATVAKVRVHAKCRLYEETFLPADAVVEMDVRLIVGIDHRGTMISF